VLLVGTGADELAQQVGLADHDAKLQPRANEEPHGTVGAVALDADGHVAVATSTGGIAGKRDGRVGDSPVIGAGSWAADESCAVSATGNGERLLLTSFARHVHDRMTIAGDDLDTAIGHALAEVSELGGGAGCIAVDRDGHLAMRFNTRGMFRGWSTSSSDVNVLGPE
jgi:isoaspartyl peptidase/L-asparaginase-like protein (Ntn-hydrolase superfamily)